jgi:PAS domain S-box-containing protein
LAFDREDRFGALTSELRCTLDREGRVSYVDGAWESMLGWLPEALHGRRWEELIHPADLARARRASARVRTAGGCERDLELRIAHAEDGHRVVSWTLVPGGGRDAVIGVGRGPSEQELGLERRNRELEARVGELEESRDAMTRFAGMAAHQLAEPLVIAESSAILVAEELGGALEPLLRDRLDAIGRGAARARRLMDALLEDARAATAPPRLRTVETREVVEDTLAALEPWISEQRAVLDLGPLPQVKADARLLAVVFDNLVMNALKHGPREGGRIGIGGRKVATAWRLEITSGGPPIAEADARRIFEPYLRLPNERRLSGSGLGLAICARLVQRMGGTLAVEPGSRDGNTFWFELAAA